MISAVKQRLGKPGMDTLLLLLISVAVGTGVFLYIYGVYPLALSNLGWIYLSQDSLQHFLGWQFFRSDPWTFPIGTITSYGYPYGVALTYTDSIPLVAILLKLINPLLQPRLQYLGWWTLLCFILQFFFAGLILRRFTKSWILQLLGAALLVFAPPMLYRTFYHTSLVSQWLILVGIYLLLAGRERRLPWWCWGLTLILATTIHPYFLPMLVPLFLITLAETYERERKAIPLLLEGVGAAAAVGLAGYAIGLFSLGTADLASSGFGTYSLNLNALFNSFGTSQFLNSLPVFHYHQDEGYNYLGLGLMVLAGVGLISLVLNGVSRKALLRNKYLLLACLFWTLFSLSGTITLNDQVLVNLPLPDFFVRLSGLFRASGRFFWPVFYLLVLLILVRVMQKVRFAQWILAGALILQILDLQLMIENKRFSDYRVYQSPLRSEFWISAASAFKHIELLPAVRQTNAYAPFAIFAANNRLSLNWGYFARGQYAEIQAYGDAETRGLIAGNAKADTLYVFCQASDINAVASSPQNPLNIYHTDEYYLGFSTANPLARAGSPWDQDKVSLDQVHELTLTSFLSAVKASEVLFVIGRGVPFGGLDGPSVDALKGLGLKSAITTDSTDSLILIAGKPLGGPAVEFRSSAALAQLYHPEEMIGAFKLPYELYLRSAGQNAGNYASLQINGKEYSHNKQGLNIIAYDVNSGDIRAISFANGYRVVCP